MGRFAVGVGLVGALLGAPRVTAQAPIDFPPLPPISATVLDAGLSPIHNNARTPRVPLYDDELQERLVAERDAERELIRSARAAEYARDRHFLLSLARDEIGFYHPTTGELLDVLDLYPNEERYLASQQPLDFVTYILQLQEPARVRTAARGCELLNRGRTAAQTAAIKARTRALESEHGVSVVTRTGRKSDYDCWAERMGDAWATVNEIYRSHGLAAEAGHMLSESTGSPIARSSAGAFGAFQFMSGHNTAANKNMVSSLGLRFFPADVFMQAWWASAHIAVDAKLLGSRALAESRYHAGNNVLRALHDGLDAVQARNELFAQIASSDTEVSTELGTTSPLQAWLDGSTITLALWSNPATRRALKTQFGPASYSYPAINVVNGEILDSIVRTRKNTQWNVHAYELLEPRSLAAIAKETGVPLEDLDSLNWHARSWTGRNRGKPFTLPKGAVVYTKQSVVSPTLRRNEYWRREDDALIGCWQAFHEWQPTVGDTTGIGKQITCFTDTKDPSMAYWLRVARGRHSSDNAMLNRYRTSLARNNAITAAVQKSVSTDHTRTVR
jgi:hypothetical protein